MELADIRAAIPADLLEPRPLRAWAGLAVRLACGAVFVTLLFNLEFGSGWDLAWQIPALAGLWLLQGLVVVGLFSIAHDCAHSSFSTREWLNVVMGYSLMSPLLNGYHVWRLTHDHHHAHTQLRGQEVDWAANLVSREEYAQLSWRRNFVTKLGYLLPFGAFFWIAANTTRRGLMLHKMLGPERMAAERVKLLVDNALMIGASGAVYGGLWYFLGLWDMVKLHGVPSLIAIVLGSLIILFQHANEDSLIFEDGWTPMRGQLVSTFDVRFPRVVEWLWCDINIHIPHHLCPAIPWYNLRAARLVLREAFPGSYQERRFSFARHLLWLRRTPFIRKVESEGYYEMDFGLEPGARAA